MLWATAVLVFHLFIYLFILGEFIGNPSLKSFIGIDHNFHIQLRILAWSHLGLQSMG